MNRQLLERPVTSLIFEIKEIQIDHYLWFILTLKWLEHIFIYVLDYLMFSYGFEIHLIDLKLTNFPSNLILLNLGLF